MKLFFYLSLREKVSSFPARLSVFSVRNPETVFVKQPCHLSAENPSKTQRSLLRDCYRFLQEGFKSFLLFSRKHPLFKSEKTQRISAGCDFSPAGVSADFEKRKTPQNIFSGKFLFSANLGILASCALFQTSLPAGAVALKTNPDISVNLLLLGQKSFGKEEPVSSKPKTFAKPGSFLERWQKAGGGGAASDNLHGHEGHSHDHARDQKDGFSIQEAEFYFKSNIDPYWTGNISLGVSYHQGRLNPDLEEAFVETLFIPNLTLRAGKFYGLLDKHNHLHTHNHPFIDPPLINKTLFGSHGWSDSGISMAWLTPLPWYFEPVIQGFYNEEKEKPSGILFLKSLWDIKDDSTLELNLAGGAGMEGFKRLFSSALTYKRTPAGDFGRHSLVWTTQFLLGTAGSSAAGDKVRAEQRRAGKGLNSQIQWKFLKNWWLSGRAEALLPETEWNEIKSQKYSLLLAFTPTEYSALRLQYHIIKDKQRERWEHGILFQSNMSLGTHPAHLY